MLSGASGWPSRYLSCGPKHENTDRHIHSHTHTHSLSLTHTHTHTPHTHTRSRTHTHEHAPKAIKTHGRFSRKRMIPWARRAKETAANSRAQQTLSTRARLPARPSLTVLVSAHHLLCIFKSPAPTQQMHACVCACVCVCVCDKSFVNSVARHNMVYHAQDHSAIYTYIPRSKTLQYFERILGALGQHDRPFTP